MKKILFFITALILALNANAAPFKCAKSSSIFYDKNQCNLACGLTCEELDPVASSGGACDTSKYQGFFTYKNKSYAITKAKVAFDSGAPLAIIRNAEDNAFITSMLNSFGVNQAFIGVYDPNLSSNYKDVDPSRFILKDGSAVEYSNWATGEPNNDLKSSDIGKISIYGEHWAVILKDGKWADIGYNQAGKPLEYAVVEFNGTLSCLLGTVKIVSGNQNLSGMYCSGAADFEGMVTPTKCSVGIEFGTNKDAYLCQYEKVACIETTSTYTCPYPNKACINDGGGYFCSPYDCSDVKTSLVSGEVSKEGANDENNNGKVDENGNCLGKLVIFPGADSRCRRPGTQTFWAQCCGAASASEIDDNNGFLQSDACNSSEKGLWVKRYNNNCHYVGKYCAEKWDGSGTGKDCAQGKETWCCFDSDFARAFAVAGHDLLNIGWGTAESPNCRGFTPDELQVLSAKGISSHPALREYAERLGGEFANKLSSEFKKTADGLQKNLETEIEGLNR